MKAELTRFAAVDINLFPTVPLEEVDCSPVIEKVMSSLSTEVREVLREITNEADSASLDGAVAVEKLSSDMTRQIGGVVEKISDEIECIRDKLNEVEKSLDGIHKE